MPVADPATAPVLSAGPSADAGGGEYALGRQLRLLRVLADVSAVDLARRAGLHPGQLGHLEAGRRPCRPEVALRLLQALSSPPACVEGRHG